MSDFPSRPEEDYVLVPRDSLLGTGKFGVVKKVIRKSDQKASEGILLRSTVFACKSIRLHGAEHSKDLAEREYTLLAPVTHPNIIKYVDIRWQEHKVKLYMEYCGNGSLQDMINVKKRTGDEIQETFVWDVLFQLAAALLYCHYGFGITQKGRIEPRGVDLEEWEPILHRDIKPANVLLFDSSDIKFDTIKLGDFGLGTTLTEENPPSTYAGTQQYMAPEINRSKSSGIRWTKKCDVFSLGCTLYALCTYKPPYEWHMGTDEDSFDPIPDRYSQTLNKCIAKCLSSDSGDRPDAFELYERAKKHVSFRFHGSKDSIPIARVKLEQPEGVILTSDLQEITEQDERPSVNVNVKSKELSRQSNAANHSSASINNSMFSIHGSAYGIAESATAATSEVMSLSMSEPATKVHWTLLRALKGHSSWVSAVAYSPDGRQIASASGDKTVRLLDSATGEARGTLKGHSGYVTAVAYSPDGRQIASASDDKTVRLWDSATGEARGTLKGHSDYVTAVAYSPDGRQIASASWDMTVRLWDSATGEARGTLKGHSDYVTAVAYSPDGRQIASASWDKTVRLWDSVTGEARGTLKGHSSSVSAVAYSPDGRQIASAPLRDKTVRLWDSATGEARGTLKGHSSPVSAVVYSPDGRQIASASWDKTVRLWDSATGEARGTLKGHSSWVTAVAYSPDGRQIASASRDKTVRVWHLVPVTEKTVSKYLKRLFR
ncbi:MAG: hypothetical protein M4579_003136 [Chaenotheca gracillima]|nr:MAG: hypothetical protein M4579_003136 [Chaenotheca gracillima]